MENHERLRIESLANQDSELRQVWEQRYGPRYYHFVYEGVLFLMMDSEDYEEKRMLEIYHARDKALKIIKGEMEGAIK